MNAPRAVPQPLFCRRLGEGPREVLALHCTMAHSGAWRGLSEAMGAAATLHAPDMLCHGKSPDWDGRGDFQTRMVDAVLPFLPRPMDVVGHSFGATVALRLAAMRPDLVRSLTLIETVHFAFVKADHPERLEQARAENSAYGAAIEAGDYFEAARHFASDWGDGGWEALPEARRAAMARAVRIVPACSPSIIDDAPGLLKPGGLAGVTMPVLLLRGDRSPELIGLTNGAIARRLTDVRNEVVPGAGHMLPITHAGALAKRLLAFFDEVPHA